MELYWKRTGESGGVEYGLVYEKRGSNYNDVQDEMILWAEYIKQPGQTLRQALHLESDDKLTELKREDRGRYIFL